jgi:L-fuculose-phosphate aldolase
MTSAPSPDTPELRERLLAAARGMSTARLNVGTSGNASVRVAGGMLITPTGLKIEDCGTTDVAFVDRHGAASGPRAPSSEWPMHLGVYADRPEAGAILHAHAPFATALACLRREIPPFHYMIARFGGTTVRCARYATFGTQALSDAVRSALHARSACLLANHGMLVFGHDPEHALDMAIEFETLCEQYWRALQIGEPALLSEAEIAEVIERFAGYGQPKSNPS